MRNIDQNSELNRDRPWLEDLYREKKERTVNLVKKSVDFLISEKLPVTLTNISQISKHIDPEGNGVHPNTVRTNTIAHSYYSKHSTSYKKVINRRGKKSTHRNNFKNYNFENIKADRDLQTVHERYKKMTKQEIINRLIAAEQYIVENNEKWVQDQFNLYIKDT